MHRLKSAGVRLESIEARPLSVPLLEPFVIATGRVDTTRAVEVEVRISWRGEDAVGLGESACLPPVTAEDQDDVLRALSARRPADLDFLDELRPVARAGVETAVYDAIARIAGVPLREWLGGSVGATTRTLRTDVTVAIAAPAKMGDLARDWVAKGFDSLKVKVGRGVDEDIRALEAIGRAAPHAKLRLDANAAYSATEALALATACARLELQVECWEQPCARDDLEGMAQVKSAVTAPVIADESIRSLEDLRVLLEERYATGVNLKLAKLGGIEAAFEVGSLAKRSGLQIMVGGMVETRLGMTAAAHVACALGGVDFVDLDTALLLASDPYEGGYEAAGPVFSLPPAPGLGVCRRS